MASDWNTLARQTETVVQASQASGANLQDTTCFCAALL
jgi:hypothetical protein